MPKKKLFIQVAGNPLYAPRSNPSKPIENPKTGTPIFGYFPEIAFQDRPFSAGPIYLRYGVHKGQNQGFGLLHIWREHFKHVSTLEEAIPLIAGRILAILQPGATIHYEFGAGTSGNRPLVFKTKTGLLVLEERLDGRNDVFYSIVTVFDARNAQGTLIGTL